MSHDFDPYHVWLGIAPEEQPPNHYRLLGIKLFEDNANVIQNAADRQMAHVNTFKTGRHVATSQYLLTELAVAAGCLLNASRKAEYDARLSWDIVPEAAISPMYLTSPPPPPPAPPPIIESPLMTAFPAATQASMALMDETEPIQVAPVRISLSRRRRPKTSAAVEMIKIVVGGAIGVGIAVFALLHFANVDVLGIRGKDLSEKEEKTNLAERSRPYVIAEQKPRAAAGRSRSAVPPRH